MFKYLNFIINVNSKMWIKKLINLGVNEKIVSFML